MACNNGQADFIRVPVVNVHKDNLVEHQPVLLRDIQDCDFIGLDCELSGLGDRKKLNAPTIDDRYKNTCLVAKTRSIISLGVSMFRLMPNSPSLSVSHWTYSVKTYNLLVLCSEDYIVEPASLQFLVEHGFDFCSQYKLGIGYKRGNDTPENETAGKQPLREMFAELVKARKPLVLHNGLIDLVFLYHNFWAALPVQLGTFVSDISEMFPTGIYDTKYIADFVSRTQASFLEFVFRKEQKINSDKCAKNRPHVKLIFEQENLEFVEWRFCGFDSDDEFNEDGEANICSSYSNHGHCPDGNSCSKSHNIDSIIRQKNEEQSRKWKKQKTETIDTEKEIIDTKDNTNGDIGGNGVKPAAHNSGGHRAGYDSFMTAFSFSTFLVHQTQLPAVPENFCPSGIKAEKLANRIYLVSKDFPMLVQKSAFSKCSVQHDIKMRKLGLYEN